MTPPKGLRQLLDDARGDGPDREQSVQDVFDLTYAELHRIAARLMNSERTGHTLQPTALLHEAYVRMVSGEPVAAEDHAHFLAIAANVMRQVLVDHARKRATVKRGGGMKRVLLEPGLVDESAGVELEVLALESCLVRLAELDARVARVVELRVFGGLSIAGIASVTSTSPRTVDSDWAFGRAWLARELRC